MSVFLFMAFVYVYMYIHTSHAHTYTHKERERQRENTNVCMLYMQSGTIQTLHHTISMYVSIYAWLYVI